MAYALLQTPSQPAAHDAAATIAASAATPHSTACADPASAWPADPALGRQLGRDYARHGLVPPPEHLSTGHPVRLGWEAARPQFVQRAQAATPEAGLLLHTRLQAWLRGQAVETLTVTPNLVRQIRVSLCPVTRGALSLGGAAPSHPARPAGVAPQRRAEDAAGAGSPSARSEAAVLSRLRPDAAFAAGHLALLSPLADAALCDVDLSEVLATLRLKRHAELQPPAAACAAAAPTAECDTRAPMARLDSAALGRLAVLMSFVTPLEHAQAAALPLLVLPPNRLRLLNPVQALQAALTLQLTHSGWSKRLPVLEALLPTVGLKSPQVRADLRSFFYLLMSRCIAMGRPGRRPADLQAWRWTLEDAWRHPQVLLAWQRFALQLDATQAEALLVHAAQAGLCSRQVRVLSPEQATEGWALPQGVPSAAQPLALASASLDGVHPFGSAQHGPAASAPARWPAGRARRPWRTLGAGQELGTARTRPAVPATAAAPSPTEQLPLPL